MSNEKETTYFDNRSHTIHLKKTLFLFISNRHFVETIFRGHFLKKVRIVHELNLGQNERKLPVFNSNLAENH